MSNVSVATITIRNRIRRRQLCYRDSWTRHEPAFVACSASCIVFFVPLLSTPPSILSRISTTFHLLRFLLLHRSATRCCCPYPGNLPKRAAPTYIHPRRSYIKCSRHTSFPFSHSLRVRQLPHSRTKSCCSICISHRLPKLASSIRSLRDPTTPRIHAADTASSSYFAYFYEYRAYSRGSRRLPLSPPLVTRRTRRARRYSRSLDCRTHSHKVRGTWNGHLTHRRGQSQAGVRAGSVTGRRVQANGTTIVDNTITRGHVTRSTSRRRRLAVD